MNSLKEIITELKKAKSVLLFPHTAMDGDCIGSSVALAHNLKKAGKTVYILLEDSIPYNLAFLDKGYCTWDRDVIPEPDVTVAVDCYGRDRMPARFDRFLSGKVKMTLDHHATVIEKEGLDHTDPQAAATGEIVYDLLVQAGIEIDIETAEALFTAITTDTGDFQYSNTTKKTHEITAALYDSGFNANRISNEIYGKVSPQKIRLETMILDTLDIIADGKGAIAYVTQEMLDRTGTSLEDTEGIAGKLRNIRGVEISAFLKENGKEEIKVSMRAKDFADVAKICEKHNGGGHTKAAGCTLRTGMDQAIKVVVNDIEEALR